MTQGEPPGPHASMLAVPQALARFLESNDESLLDGLFSEHEVTILENFAPHLFQGQGGLGAWRRLMAAHVGKIDQLRHRFGAAQDYAPSADQAFFTLPTMWTGIRDGVPFIEHGGWSFLLVREDGCWRIRAYGWAVTSVQA
ncbi:hypothetical protein [Allosphingosinicella deserti]|uniref:SnoaL-like domain-containing protein n=1 Tax=Allosphingosinicella deserti TaxID=2116704 RepID=A0A2P7QYL5_9SPHN|nr:hypothetical protein [Sphingomonas deserti]PSJ43039.1 hypothetical protein C7I55_01160 [Sphingomonas deserti]